MSTGTGSATSRGCCENGRPIITDPHTGQTICSCQYSSTLLNYPRVPGLTESVYGGASAYAAAAATQGYLPLGAEGSAFYSPLNGPYDVKDNPDGLRSLAQPASYFPYDPSMAVYPYGTGYGGLDLNARRKNATRETTNTLKAWLYEHRKNPYPTKGEKIMLAIITKMTLTQVSTWFANARRRLKKENKMTWSPRNRSEDSTDNLDSEGETENKESENGDASLAATAGVAEKEDAGDETPRVHSPGHMVVDPNEGPREKIIESENDSDPDSDVDDEGHPLIKGEHLSTSSKERRALSLRHGHTGKHSSNGVSLSANDSRRVDALSDSTRDSETTKDSHLPGLSSSNSSHNHNNSSNNSSSTANSNHNSQSRNDRDTASPPRPKIWSVSQFLVNSPSSSNDSNSNSSSPVGGVSGSSGSKSVATVLTSGNRLHPSPGYLYLQSASQSWNGGRYGALSAYPISMSHTTLSYPYTLSTHTSSKTALGVASAAVHNAASVELLHSADKLASTQKGLFSPARDIDGMRNRLFPKEAAKYF